MNEIFSADELPDRRLAIQSVISTQHHMKIGQAIMLSQENMARQIARKIMDGEPFFKTATRKMGDTKMLEIRADCIVLTTEELRDLKMKSFSQGVSHAQGFMPLP